MSPDEYLTTLVMSLSEIETLQLIQALDSSSDIPPFVKGEFETSEVTEWISRNQESLVAALTRIVDLTDEAIAYLFRLGVLPISNRDLHTVAIQLRFFVHSDLLEEPRVGGSQDFALNELAASSAMLSEICSEVAAANHSFGLTIPPPIVTLERGSLQYTIGGGLLASGVALVMACGSGLVASPLGLFGGGVLACAGVLDLSVNWVKSIAETRKVKAEAYKLYAEARKLDAEARKLDLEGDELESKQFDREDYHHRAFAHSKLVPRDVVLREAKRLGLEQGYANHILNRVLPKYRLMSNYLGHTRQDRNE